MTEPATVKRIDERLDRIEGDVRELRGDVRDLRAETKAGFEAMDAKWDAKFDRLNRTIVYLLGGSLSVLVSVLAGALVAAVLHALL